MKQKYFPTNCPVCGEVFKPYYANGGSTKTCSVKCAAVLRKSLVPWNKGKRGEQVGWSKGVPRSEETKKKISESLKGRKQSKATIEKRVSQFRGDKHWLYGKNHSKETREKISQKVKEIFKDGMPEETKRKISITNGGTGKSCLTNKRYYHRKDKKYKEWRKKVFERDEYTCQHCQAKSGKDSEVYLEPHHIKGWAKYEELRYELSNGITLCRECHKLTRKRK